MINIYNTEHKNEEETNSTIMHTTQIEPPKRNSGSERSPSQTVAPSSCTTKGALTMTELQPNNGESETAPTENVTTARRNKKSQHRLILPAVATGESVLTISELIERLGKEIDGLIQYVEPRRNVHGDIRKMCSIIKRTHTELSTELDSERRKSRPTDGLKQLRKLPATVTETIEIPPKKRKRVDLSPKGSEQERNTPTAMKTKADTVSLQMPSDKWTKVEKKEKSSKVKNKIRSIRPKADAILIEKKVDGTTYADILKKVKDSGEAQSSERKYEELLDAIGEQAQVKKPDKSSIRSKRTTYAGTQSAYVSLPADDAKKLLALGHIKVGWVRCRITEVISPKRCYKCWAYDHIAAACKAPDRTKLCRRCGKEGHQAANCTNTEKCVLCEGPHAAGSAKCPRYQEAVHRKKT
ncbi:uncharacterized protein LOC119688676 [Teleopsis dalmanni]|uniref:uncharacterized protein LOC119688676 n=1 Tax=Teleopsis dalmanni TaxID=139649 RepID=UPI0018CE11F1|nr:uncharacterized protein LOC119688676 [Teleopsis dalmanni]